MKKIISLMLAMVLMCGCLVGCGSDKKVGTVALEKKGGYQYYGFDISPKDFNQRFNQHITVKENKMTKVTNEKAYKEGSAEYDSGNGILNAYVFDQTKKKVTFIVTYYDSMEKTDQSVNQFKDAIQANIKVINPTISSDELNSIFNKLDFDGIEKWSRGNQKQIEFDNIVFTLKMDQHDEFAFHMQCKLEKAE